MVSVVRDLDVFKASFKERVDGLNSLASGLQKTCLCRQWPPLAKTHATSSPAVAALQNEHALLTESYQEYYKKVTADVTCSISALAKSYESRGKKIIDEYSRLSKEFLQYKCVKQPSSNAQKAQQILAEFTAMLSPLVVLKNELEQSCETELRRILVRFVDHTEVLARQELGSVTAVRAALDTSGKLGPMMPVGGSIAASSTQLSKQLNSDVYSACVAIGQHHGQ